MAAGIARMSTVRSNLAASWDNVGARELTSMPRGMRLVRAAEAKVRWLNPAALRRKHVGKAFHRTSTPLLRALVSLPSTPLGHRRGVAQSPSVRISPNGCAQSMVAGLLSLRGIGLLTLVRLRRADCARLRGVQPRRRVRGGRLLLAVVRHRRCTARERCRTGLRHAVGGADAGVRTRV